MSTQRNLVAVFVAAGLMAAYPGSLSAQESRSSTSGAPEASAQEDVLEGASIVMKVEGMSCPFCAYGLEKRLRELPAVEELLIRVSDGVVQIRVKEGQQVDDEALRKAVERAGFTPAEIERIGP